MKILITGANGLLGRQLVQLLLSRNHIVIATGRGPSRLSLENNKHFKYREADVVEGFVLNDIMHFEKPDAVVHAAAMTQVDACELNRSECFETNVSATFNAMSSAEKYSGHFVFVSTDFVFDGKEGNYKETDEMNPVNWYGNTKQQAEQLVYGCNIPWAIARTCLVYGHAMNGNRTNILGWIKDSLEKKKKINMVDDQFRTATFVNDLAGGILLILEKKSRGIFHIAGKDLLTPYGIALQTADFFSLDKNLIKKVNETNFSQAARRPLKTGLIIDKARKELGYEPSGFKQGLAMFAKDE